MAEVRLIAVEAEDDGVRLDRWLRRRWPHLAQGRIHKLCRSGQLRIDGARTKAETRLATGAVVRVPPLADAEPLAESPALSDRDRSFVRGLTLYEDDQILVLNKPAGLAVQGGTGTSRHLDGLLSAFGEGERRPRLVHRLDRDTSGVLVLGKTASAAARLAAAFAGRDMEKTYWAIVAGAPEPPRGVIDLSLARTGIGDRERMAVIEPLSPRALAATSEYATLAVAPDRDAAWLALRPHTGRTHQLRAHMQALGHPILGDRKYGGGGGLAAAAGLGLQLHARRLRGPHPADGRFDVEAPAGAALRQGLARFGFNDTDAPPDPFA